MPREIPERYRWAVDLLDVRPDDRILEIGSGHGHMIGLICERLTTGHITAIDRSDARVHDARERNKPHLESAKAEILHQELLDTKLHSTSFDKVFLFNINTFWMDPVQELAEVRRLLRPSGEFHIFHLPPPGHELGEFMEAFLRNLSGNGFYIRVATANEDLFTLHIVSHLYRPN